MCDTRKTRRLGQTLQNQSLVHERAKWCVGAHRDAPVKHRDAPVKHRDAPVTSGSSRTVGQFTNCPYNRKFEAITLNPTLDRLTGGD
jgi:hypothetical protein